MRKPILFGVALGAVGLAASAAVTATAAPQLLAAPASYEDAERAGPSMRAGHGPRDRGRGMRHAVAALEVADLNGDNTITRQEHDALRVEMFAWMDRSGDGVLDDADRSPIAQRKAALHGDEDGPRRGGKGRKGPMGQVDTNGDGRVTQAEFMAAEPPVFARLDANADGAITPAELDAAAAERDARRYWWRS